MKYLQNIETINRKRIFLFIGFFLLISISAIEVRAQSEPTPQGAFLRSLILPGWGHHYADRTNWNRGKVHLGTDVVLIGTIFGFSERVKTLEGQFQTLSNLRAGVDITGRNRSFQLAIGNFDSLAEYNDFQLRTRNWNRLIEDTPENRWNWENPDDRQRYRELRSTREQLRNQIPALAGFMVVNRIISGISAYNRVQNQKTLPEVSVIPVEGTSGIRAQLRFNF